MQRLDWRMDVGPALYDILHAGPFCPTWIKLAKLGAIEEKQQILEKRF